MNIIISKDTTKIRKLYKFQTLCENLFFCQCTHYDTDYYSFGESEEDAQNKFSFTANGTNFSGICSECIVNYLVATKSMINIKDNVQTVISEKYEERKDCDICKDNSHILFKFNSTANYDFNAGICEDCLSNLLVDNKYPIVMSDDLKPLSIKFLGVVKSESGNLIIGDPKNLVYSEKSFKTLGKDWGRFLKKVDPMITRLPHKMSHEKLAISFLAKNCGCLIPVFAKIEDGKIKNVLIDFEGSYE